MSNVGGGLAGRGTTFWIGLAGVGIVIFLANYAASSLQTDRETWARGLVAEI